MVGLMIFQSTSKAFERLLDLCSIFLQLSSSGISLSTGRDADRGKVIYIWIPPDPMKAGPTLGGGVVVVVSSSGDF